MSDLQGFERGAWVNASPVKGGGGRGAGFGSGLDCGWWDGLLSGPQRNSCLGQLARACWSGGAISDGAAHEDGHAVRL